MSLIPIKPAVVGAVVLPLILVSFSFTETIRFFFFSLLPLLCAALFFRAAEKRIKALPIVIGMMTLAVGLHLRNAVLFSPAMYTDSMGYMAWGKTFCEGNGFPGMWYRAPLYPLLLGIKNYSVPDHPEDAWDINRIPHLLMDSLLINHGYSPHAASRLLTRMSTEGFIRHPVRYALSIGATMKSLLFEQHEIPVALQEVYPFSDAAPFFVRAILRTFSWVQGMCLFAMGTVLFLQNTPVKSSRWLPFFIALFGYLSTAMVQVGFSRYTAPWIPCMCMCTAYVYSTLSGYIVRVLHLIRSIIIRIGFLKPVIVPATKAKEYDDKVGFSAI